MLRLALVLLVLADTFQSLVWSLRSLRVQQQKKSRRLSPLGAHKTEEDRLKQCQNDWNARLLANKEDKINELEADETEETEGQEARVRGIEGLMSAGDTYDPHLFSAEHKAFKAYHNLLFATVSHQCNQLGGGEGSVFYLDGPDAGTTKALLSFMNTDPAAGPAQALPFTGAQLCTANRYADTCRSIEHAAETHLSGQGGDIRVLNRSAKWALEAKRLPGPLGLGQEAWVGFGLEAFAGFYFDGCSGNPRAVLEMVAAALAPNKPHTPHICLGFTITKSCKPFFSLFDREQLVLNCIREQAIGLGYGMSRVADDPAAWGLPHAADLAQVDRRDMSWVPRESGTTVTTWVVLSKE